MNTQQKTIEAVIAPPPPHMVGDGFRVHSFFPGNQLIDKKKNEPILFNGLQFKSRIYTTYGAPGCWRTSAQGV